MPFRLGRALMLVLLAACLGAAPPAGTPLQRLLPARVAGQGWRLKAAPRLISGDAIFEYMDGAGEIPRACGYRALAVGQYETGRGGTVTAELYDMGSSTNAFALYSMKRDPGGRFITLGHRAQVRPGELIFWKGRYTAILFAERSRTAADAGLIALGKAIAASIRPAGAVPDLLRYLPRQGYVENSVRLFRGKAALDTLRFFRQDLFALASKPEALVATYRQPAGHILIARYATPAAAAAVEAALRRSPEARGLSVTRQGCLVGAVWSPSPAAARQLVTRLTRTLRSPGPPWPEA